MPELYDNITSLKGIGEKKAQAFAKLGVFSLFDLISFFPARYEDRSTTKPLALVENGERVCVSVIVADEPRLIRIRRGLDYVRFKAFDDTGTIEITYFNQSWMKNNIHKGEEYVFFGKIDTSGKTKKMSNPIFEPAESHCAVTGKIIPVYHSTEGLSQKIIVQCVETALAFCGSSVPNIIPAEISAKHGLISSEQAFRNIHFPDTFEELEEARNRLRFEELFVLGCALGKVRSARKISSHFQIQKSDINEFYGHLPFSPTNAQKRAVNDALSDMCSGYSMNRLVQGDVGSGKTLVAAALIWAACKNGYLSALMAPTEILAEQHCRTLSSFLSPYGINVAMLTGSMTAKQKRETKESILRGEVGLVVGTHALLSDGVEYPDLALVITDEQHRFGVSQRSTLVEKGCQPHVLVMSATPIPRTLALIIYGDLDVSIIDELPPGRQTVETFAVDSRYRERLNSFIQKQAENHNQVFIVCPMVNENDALNSELVSAEQHMLYLQSKLPQLKIACVHGKMKSKEKEAIMSAFASGYIDVLVSTTVIEVGVDVPNATLMIIENAERFGLSQLHQLRGRVGRGKAKSYCVLVSDAQGDEAKSRLGIMCKTGNGFKIAEEDLRLRGPGDFFGSRQHGLPSMHIADLGADASVLAKAKEEAEALLDIDPELASSENAELRRRIDALFTTNRDSIN